MLNKATKILFAELFILPLALAFFCLPVKADDPTPPVLPVFYYGDISVDSIPAPAETVVLIKRLTDNSEFGNFSPSEAGKYFYEMACAGIVGENLFFTTDGYVAGETVCPDVAVTASVNLNLSVDKNNPRANNWTSSFNVPSSLAPEDEAKINFTPTLAGADKQVTIGPSGLIITRGSVDPLMRFEIVFPAGTVITGSGAWDGSILAPTVRATSTIDVPDEPEHESSVIEAVELGFSAEALTFDRPVRIFLPGQSGKRVGYSRPGSAFTEITGVCPLNNGDSLVGGVNECKFDNGADIFIWTKHFTSFVTYIQTALPPAPPRPVMGGSFSGGGRLFIGCANIEYGEWASCADGKQIRTVISRVPVNCEMNEAEMKLLEQACTITEEKKPEEEEKDEEKEDEGGIVLGEKIYPDGSLIRSIDRKIYYLENQTRRHIVNLGALKKFKGQPIREVSVFTLYAYPEGEKIHEYGEGDLIKGSDKKIYLIKNNKKLHIKTLDELKKNYFGKKIILV